MTLNKKTIAGLITAILALFGGGTMLGSYVGESPTFVTASSTVFTLTTASQRLLGTSTPAIGRRMAALIQPYNCTGGQQAIFMRMGTDVAATANTGSTALGSTTGLVMGDLLTPPVQGSVTGITAVGTCSVSVTEWIKRQ